MHKTLTSQMLKFRVLMSSVCLEYMLLDLARANHKVGAEPIWSYFMLSRLQVLP